MTTAAQDKTRELEAHGTAGSRIVTKAAISLALILAQYSYVQGTSNDGVRILERTEGTASRAESLQINDLDLFSQINRVYDDLLQNQIELDGDSKRVLYENLWDLYT